MMIESPDDEERTSVPPAPTISPWGTGDRRWFLNAWATIAVGMQATGGTVDVVTMDLPAGYAPPGVRHDHRTEVLVVIDGELELELDGHRWQLGGGGVAFLPAGATHALTVGLGGPARVVVISHPGGLSDLIAEVGQSPAAGTEPTLRAPDLSALADAGRRHDSVYVTTAVVGLREGPM